MKIEHQFIYGNGPAKPCTNCGRSIPADSVSCDLCQHTQSEFGELIQNSVILVIPRDQMPTISNWPSSTNIGLDLSEIEHSLKSQRLARGKDGILYDLFGRGSEERRVRKKIDSGSASAPRSLSIAPSLRKARRLPARLFCQ